MIEFYFRYNVPTDFTGVCKLIHDKSICYYKNGILHREDGPAIEYENGKKHWLVNGLFHREDGPAIEEEDSYIQWFYKSYYYGYNNNFTIESWKEKVKQLKREEELKIFK